MPYFYVRCRDTPEIWIFEQDYFIIEGADEYEVAEKFANTHLNLDDRLGLLVRVARVNDDVRHVAWTLIELRLNRWVTASAVRPASD